MAGLLDLLSDTWPARLAQSAWGAATLPGDVYAGRVTPNDPQYYNRATDLAGLMVGTPATPVGALGSGIKAYHASPANFERFDPAKIGSGMGHNYYGEGFYFHENPRIAEAIRDQYFPGGKVYETNIHADPNAMLQWDKPIAAQPQGVKDSLSAFGLGESLNQPAFMQRNLTGRDAMNEMLNQETPAVRKALGRHDISTPAQGTSEMLQQKGVPGISYPASEGGRGYVAFPQTAIDILKKYGIAGLLGLGAISQEASQQ